MAEHAVVAAARTNVLGTMQTLGARAKAVGARFVFISSDKAAEPRSVMGATKRFAELVVLDQATPQFRPIVTRFGNILGSSGSVVEIMLRARRARPPGAADRLRRDPLLHDRRRGGVAGDEGDADRRGRGSVLARHGRPDAHRRPGRTG